MSLEIDNSFQEIPTIQVEPRPSLYTRIGRICDLIVQVVFKEFYSVLVSTVNMVRYLFNKNKYNLNLQTLIPTNQTAKVVILLHGQGGGPFCFFPMAKEFERQGIKNVYTVKLSPTDNDPLPLAQLEGKIEEIKARCLAQGIDKVDFALIGHSLGALVSMKKIWRGDNTDTKISLMVSFAGRLKYQENRFAWFCADVRPEVEENYRAYRANPYLANLHTVWGQKDEIVPEESSHIQGNSDKELSVEGYGHGGVVYSNQAISKAADWVNDWIAAETQKVVV